MAEYVKCPSCGSKVLTADTFLGQQVRCFGCGRRFLASADSPEKPVEPRAPTLSEYEKYAAPESARPADEEEDWPYCPGCGRVVSWTDIVCPHCREEFADDDRRSSDRRARTSRGRIGSTVNLIAGFSS